MTLEPFTVPARFYEQHPSGKIRCTLCPFHCLIAEEHDGFCGTRRVRNGVLEAVNWGLVVSAAMDPIEKKPLYHFHPGSSVLSFGGIGCNLACLHCQNSSISSPRLTRMDVSGETPWTPEKVVRTAVDRRADGIAFTYNEPTIWFEWALETCILAKKENLYTVFVTNAYIEQAPLDELGPYIDAYAADIKGWGADFYRRFAKIPRWEKILDAIDRAKNVHSMHVEITTNVVPGWNDDDESLKSIAQWILDKLGPLTVWHLSRFIPHHKLSHLEPTPSETLIHARKIGLDTGLKHVFLGNVHGMKGVEDTYCPDCGALVIERTGYITRLQALDGTCCSHCGAEVGIVR
ncbi:MAG TPA: AmmeMemoRadiSam system radical SAM enzyme [Firmicutes bacterium]|nr:AmmeMemoRadiSam system radical SAM enzyme [Bacillota bacterium]